MPRDFNEFVKEKYKSVNYIPPKRGIDLSEIISEVVEEQEVDAPTPDEGTTLPQNRPGQG